MPDPFKNVKIIELMELFDDDEVTTADKIDRPQEALDREAYEDFMERNPLAGGGMLVQPGFGGVRQGYKEKNLDRAAYKKIRPITQANIDNYAFFTSKEAAKPYKFKVQLPGGTEVFKTRKEAQAAIDAAPITNRDYTEGLIDFKVPKGATNFDKGRVKIPTGEFVGEGRDKSQIFKIQNKDGSNVKYTTSGAGGGKKKLYNSIEEVKKAKLKSLPDELVKVDSKIIKEGISEVTYKNKKTGKIVKYYKPRVGESKETIPDKGTTSLKEAEKFIKDYYVRNPKPVRDPAKDYTSKDVRKKSLLETDPTKAKGTKKFNYHHIRQIAGGVPLTTDDVMIINQRINSALGTKYNQPLNAISAAIQKNNRLALEAMNAKQEGVAYDLMQRVDELNAQAEKIVNSAIDKLPKKYKGYVGFNQFTLPRDEYGLPISNEPMIIRKVGGMPVSKDAIDLTTLNLKQQQEFKKIVKQQAERGKTGPIKGLSAFVKNLEKLGCGKAAGGRVFYSEGALGLTKCAKKGQTKLNNILTKGTTNRTEQLLATQILKAGPLLRSAVSLPALLGPQAMIFYAGTEAGLIGYDMVSKGKTLKEAVGDSLINPLLGPKLKQDSQKLFVERLKNLGVSDQEIGKGLMFDRMTEDVQTLNNLLQRKFIADQKVEQAKKFSPAVLDKRKKEASDIAMDIQDIYRTGDRNVLDALEFERFQKPETLKRFVEAGSQKKRLEELAEADRLRDSQEGVRGFIKKIFQGERGKAKDREKIGEFFDVSLKDANPALFSPVQRAGGFTSGFAGGGIAKLAGIDEGPPPKSGPNSQGLSGLIKRGNKI